MVESTKPQPLRRLGNFERMMSALQPVGCYAGTALTCRYTIPARLSGDNSREELEAHWERAVARAMQQHNILQLVQLDEDSTKPIWAVPKTVDLSKHITWTIIDPSLDYDSEHRKIVRQKIDEKFPNVETEPGWRLVVVRHGRKPFIDAMLAWNHAHFDGMGSKIFHETLLRELNAPPNTDELVLNKHIFLTTATKDNVTPSVEQVVKFPLSLPFAASIIREELAPQFLVSKNNTTASWSPTKLPAGTPYQTMLRGIRIDNRTTTAVLAACRQHNTTLTGFIHAVALVSLAPILDRKGIESPGLASDTPLSLRRHMPVKPAAFPDLDPNRTMANYVSKVYHRHEEAVVSKIKKLAAAANSSDETRMKALEDPMWSAAQQTRRELEQRIARGLNREPVGLLKYGGDLRTYLRDKASKPRQTAWMVTNIGVLDGGKKAEDETAAATNGPANGEAHDDGSSSSGDENADGWSIQRATFSLSADVPGPMYQLSPIAVKGGDLCIDMSWPRGVFDDEVGEELIGEIEKWFHFVGGNGKA